MDANVPKFHFPLAVKSSPPQLQTTECLWNDTRETTPAPDTERAAESADPRPVAPLQQREGARAAGADTRASHTTEKKVIGFLICFFVLKVFVPILSSKFLQRLDT